MKKKTMDRRVTVRLSSELFDDIEQMAADSGVRPSEFARSLIAEGAARRRAIRLAECDDPMKFITRFVVYLSSDLGFLRRLMEFPEFKKDIRADSEDAEK